MWYGGAVCHTSAAVPSPLILALEVAPKAPTESIVTGLVTPAVTLRTKSC